MKNIGEAGELNRLQTIVQVYEKKREKKRSLGRERFGELWQAHGKFSSLSCSLEESWSS